MSELRSRSSCRGLEERGRHPVAGGILLCRPLHSADDSNTFKKAGGPCNYAGGGLIGLNPVQVIGDSGRITRMFAFADA